MPQDVLRRPTYATMLKLYDNYAASVQMPEVVTKEEIAEEKAFLDAVFNTTVMQKAYRFLVDQSIRSINFSITLCYLSTKFIIIKLPYTLSNT